MIVMMLFLFAFGSAIGSFLNVVIYRMTRGESFVYGRSYCDHCKRQLAWYENIPLLSFLALRGRCRTCHKRIDASYPLIEAITGVMFVWWYLIGFTFFQLARAPFTYLQPAFWLVVGIIFILVFFIDLFKYVIPDVLVVVLSVLALMYRSALLIAGIFQPYDYWMAIASAFGFSLLFYALVRITKGRGMGLGDVKFMFPLGLILGFPQTILAVYLAFIIGAVVAVALLVARKKKFGQVVPFAPFLILGSVLSLIWGEPLLSWYFGLL
ncbi:MAG: Type 4 prepilin-like protein leader peptide-processing enzyme [Microgenomates group bacterium GW2011_GWF2_45_18]|nr:MAG: Type 4 prepilin-like protein leader peptide-processing enzyme [Microgenomates group bacterium GW2011_GWF1_44_10]KKU01772.1 MAG: Type 4 prepilin-like protein leader peptide-processing enzyme [Microgenomates group bacterium GW2011_GWF2_45_18]OGJ41487.1 MAG: hypothetical protein A2378_04405 [Candidatus Pacebacteria bacterium RIFOXYB1_FULL_44_10]HAU98924.1 prepilin peptidase [Candidatus Paceibacterota bacterium]HAX01119.1 prepilin peptidase [Candidatus Paceibacterota bacterium]